MVMRTTVFISSAALVVFLFLLWLLAPILLPFVVGIILAYLVNPIVEGFKEHFKFPRWVGASLIVAMLIGGLIGIMALLVPYGIQKLGAAADYMPTAKKNITEHIIPALEARLPLEELDLRERLVDSSEKIFSVAVKVVKNMGSQTMALFDLLSLLFITPLVVFYLLRDWPSFVATAMRQIPREWVKPTEHLLCKTDEALAGFLRGQMMVCFALGIFYAAGLGLIGLNGGILIGVLTGLFSFVPILGMTLGVAIAAIVAFMQYGTGGYESYVLIATVFAIGQALEGAIFTPKFVGEKVQLHPAWVIFALLAGGQLGGFLGVVIALPTAAVVNVFVREAIAYWQDSDAYSGQGQGKKSREKKARTQKKTT